MKRLIEWNGTTQSIAAWSRETGIGKTTLRNRLDSGWPVERAMQNVDGRAREPAPDETPQPTRPAVRSIFELAATL